MTPRENLLKTIKCEDPEWMPIVFYADRFNQPSLEGMPEDLANLFREKLKPGGNVWEVFLPMSDYLGINEYVFFPPSPYRMTCAEGVEEYDFKEGENKVHVIKTPKGELKQIVKPGIGAGTILKRYVSNLEDLAIFMEYALSWKPEPNIKNIEQIRTIKSLIGDNGIIINGNEGTPLGMMYRLYANITELIYMTMDAPEMVQELFDIMEDKYQDGMKMLFEETPEIDVYLGMDDTSTTIISPGMFEKYNVNLTDQRTDLAQKYDRIYMHHSCGLIKDLLPIYRKTKMAGVNAFTTPPIGNVTFKEGRELLGPDISIYGGYETGLVATDTPDYMKEVISRRCKEARDAKNVVLTSQSADSSCGIDYLKIQLEAARKYQKY
jgi:hypothetical protein